MDIKKVKELLEQQLDERRELITAIKTQEPEGLPRNWGTAHTSIKPFGDNWGRGVLFRKNNGEFRAKIGGYGTSHAILKSSANMDMSVEKTFYFGLVEKTLYIISGSVGRGNFSTAMLKEIAASIAEQGPLRGSKYDFSRAGK